MHPVGWFGRCICQTGGGREGFLRKDNERMPWPSRAGQEGWSCLRFMARLMAPAESPPRRLRDLRFGLRFDLWLDLRFEQDRGQLGSSSFLWMRVRRVSDRNIRFRN